MNTSPRDMILPRDYRRSNDRPAFPRLRFAPRFAVRVSSREESQSGSDKGGKKRRGTTKGGGGRRSGGWTCDEWIDRIFQSRRKPIHRRQSPRPPSARPPRLYLNSSAWSLDVNRASERVQRSTEPGLSVLYPGGRSWRVRPARGYPGGCDSSRTTLHRHPPSLLSANLGGILSRFSYLFLSLSLSLSRSLAPAQSLPCLAIALSMLVVAAGAAIEC